MITPTYSGVTLNGFYRYMPTLFDELNFPPDTFERRIFINVLRRRWGMAMPYLQNPAHLAEQIGIWGEQQQDNFAMLWAAFTATYNPIHNYDRTEEETETPNITIEDSGSLNMARSGEDGYKQNGTDKIVRSGSDTNTASGTDSLNRSGSDTNTASGTDSLNRSGTDTSTLSGSDTSAKGGTDTVTASGTDTVAHSGTDKLTKDNRAYNSGTLITTGEDVSTRDLSDSTTYGKKDIITHEADEVYMYGKKDSRETSGEESTTYGRKDSRQTSGEESTTYGRKDSRETSEEESTTYGRGNTITYGRKDDHTSHNTRTETGERRRNVRAFGNIGVTTSVRMLQQELAMRREFDPYNYLADIFADEFLSHVM